MLACLVLGGVRSIFDLPVLPVWLSLRLPRSHHAYVALPTLVPSLFRPVDRHVVCSLLRRIPVANFLNTRQAVDGSRNALFYMYTSDP